jgi:hypothetical protein
MPADGNVEDRQRMDEAFVEHAKDDVHDHECRRDQCRLARQRRLECLGVALERPDNGAGHADIARRIGDSVHGFAKCDASGKIEGEGRGRKLALMVDG